MADFDIFGYGSTELRKAASATTLQGAIRNFQQALELSDTLSSTVANRQQLVSERAKNSALIDVEKTNLIGSYARSTQIKSLDTKDVIDVDSLLILKGTESNLKKYWHNNDGGTRVLEDLRSSLTGYQGLTATVDRPAVKLEWSNMKMEMVPAFRHPHGGFYIPAGSWLENTWQRTDPIGDAEKITSLNQKSNGDLVPLTKMLKCWNRTHSKVIGSFALETVLYHSVDNNFNSLEIEMSHFFKKLLDFNGKDLSAPSGIGKAIQIRLNYWDENYIRNAEANVRKAYSLASQGRHQEAISTMAQVFGHPFQGSR